MSTAMTPQEIDAGIRYVNLALDELEAARPDRCSGDTLVRFVTARDATEELLTHLERLRDGMLSCAGREIVDALREFRDSLPEARDAAD